MTDHTVKAFDADLSNLLQMIAKMGELVETEFKTAVESLVRRDQKLVQQVIGLDESNDALHREIETNAIALIARRQPVAYDLRLVVAVWETAIELNHIGDLALSIATRKSALGVELPMPEPAKAVRRIARAALRRLRDAVHSLVVGDVAKAEGLWRSDHEMDTLYGSLCRELLTYMMADPSATPTAVNLLFCAKSVESVGDHVTNIADAVHYLVQGRRIEASRDKAPLRSELPLG
jgi:phosphate transport system protein